MVAENLDGLRVAGLANFGGSSVAHVAPVLVATETDGGLRIAIHVGTWNVASGTWCTSMCQLGFKGYCCTSNATTTVHNAHHDVAC